MIQMDMYTGTMEVSDSTLVSIPDAHLFLGTSERLGWRLPLTDDYFMELRQSSVGHRAFLGNRTAYN